MPTKKEKSSFIEQFKALKNLFPFFKMVWNTSKTLTALNVLLRLLKSVLPLIVLAVGKEIIDEVLFLIEKNSDDLSNLWFWVVIELALAILSEIMNITGAGWIY